MFTGWTMDAVGKFVSKVGLPAAFALFLLYIVGIVVLGRLDALVTSQASTMAVVVDTHSLLEGHIEAGAPMMFMQQQIVNLQLAQCVAEAARAESPREARTNRDACFAALYAQPQK